MITQLRTRSLLVAAAGMLAFASCQQDQSTKPAEQPLQVEASAKPTDAQIATVARVSNTPVPSNCGPYKIILESTTNNGNGTYTWTWSVRNPAPGNGYCNTLQNLCFWAIRLNNCFVRNSNGCWTTSTNGAKLSNITGAAVSVNGSTWYSFNPSSYFWSGFLFFPYGTSGSSKTFYRITVNQDYKLKNALAYYFSGHVTGDGCTCYPGLGCPEETPDGGGDDGGGGDD